MLDLIASQALALPLWLQHFSSSLLGLSPFFPASISLHFPLSPRRSFGPALNTPVHDLHVLVILVLQKSLTVH